MNGTGLSRYQVRVISPRLEPPNPALTFEMAEADVSMRLGNKELDWSPLGEVRIDRVDSETFSIQLRSNEWIVRPLDVAGFLFGTRERLEAPPERTSNREREASPFRSLAWAVLHGFLALSILGIGVVIGRYSLDGSNVLSAMVAILVMGVGLLWSRVVPGRETPRSNRPAAGIRHAARPVTGGRLRGDVDVLKDILGDRIQAGPRPPATPPRPAVIEDAPWLDDVELPTLEQGADDLTIIRGIGPAVASRLASAGIVTFKQIARLTDAEFHKLARVLGAIMHRIDLDAWHRDAKMAYEHKYGRPLDADAAEVATAPEPADSAVAQPDLAQPEPQNESAQKEPAQKEPAQREPAQREPAQREPAHEEPQPEPVEPEPERTAPGAHSVSPNGGSVRPDADFAWWGSEMSDDVEIESAWREIDDSVLMLDPDEPLESRSPAPFDGRFPASDDGDDLTAIKGIGKATAQKLADIGIVSLAQIAQADAEQISHMEAALGFRSGRFSSEKWQEQARDLLQA